MKRSIMKGIGCCLVALSLGVSSAMANDKPLTYDRVSLSADAQRKVGNDLLTAELYIQREGDDAGGLAQEVNRSIQWALDEAKRYPAVRVQTEDYRTQPLYNKQTLIGWRVRQSIRLECADTAPLSELIGVLQKRLAVANIVYMLSPERRAAVENELIGEAIAAFEARAHLIAKQFGRGNFRLVDVTVGASGYAPRQAYRGAVMSMRAEAAAPPSIEPGSQTVQVNVNGTIELKVD